MFLVTAAWAAAFSDLVDSTLTSSYAKAASTPAPGHGTVERQQPEQVAHLPHRTTAGVVARVLRGGLAGAPLSSLLHCNDRRPKGAGP